jgi:phosphatidylglycerol:prolipoprotein diacylglycerol transferase
MPDMATGIPFPDIGPEIFSISVGGMELALRWYAMAYIVGILIGWRIFLVTARTARLWPGETPPMTKEQVEDFLTWVVIGIIAGGRLGYVIFYQPGYYLSHPVEALYLWQGGMSFHGGMLGVVAAWLWYCRKHAIPIPQVGDLLSISVPAGLLLGRIANFINAELWGRPTDMPWGVIFPGERAQDCPGVTGPCARHPSQLYEAGLEGLILGALLLWLAWRRGWLKRPGQITGLFAAGYGVSRFFVEVFRQADPQYITADNPMGYVLRLGDAGLSMGQLLSLPMIFGGLLILVLARRRA